VSQDDDGGRTPPQALEAEQAVLGSMMLDPQAIADAVEIIAADDFYRPAHTTLFGVMLDLYVNGQPVDPITVFEECTQRSIVNKIGTASYLHSLIAAVPTAANCAYYARIVRDKGVLRRMIAAGTRIVQMGYGANDADQGIDADGLMTSAQGLLADAAQRQQSSDIVRLDQVIDSSMEEIEAIGSRLSHGVVGVPTGFNELDDVIHGLHPGQLVIVAGRPGLGKSTLATDFMRSASIRCGMPSVIFSLEMSRTEIVMRLFSAEARVPLENIRGGRMSDENWHRLATRLGEIVDAPLYIDDSPMTTPVEMRTKCRRLKATVDIRLIVVDYVQLMTSGRRAENRQQEVSEMTRQLKLLAKELGVPVVALAQLNRNPETRGDKRPILSDLRESGSLEQDADVVILLHREDYYDKESPRAGEADLIVAKQRNGPTRTVPVVFQGHYSRFMDMTHEHERPSYTPPPPDWHDPRDGKDD
jgi:replicative DNA helicase